MRLLFLPLILILVLISIIAIIIATRLTNSTESCLLQREHILQMEKALSTGGKNSLTTKENSVNKLLLREKISELLKGHQNISEFLPAQHFFHVKTRIEKSKVFSIIKKIPKGASLHTHFSTAASMDYIMENITYRENLYGCFINDTFKLRFLENPHGNSDCYWKELKEYRTDVSFDKWLHSQLSLVVDNPIEKYTNSDTVWRYFQKIFGVLEGLLFFRPAFEDYVYQILKELHDDNVMYTELRADIFPLYELNGTVHDTIKFFYIFTKVVDEFKSKHPNFIGVRYIYSINRTVTVSNLKKGLTEIARAKNMYSDFIAGLDLVGYEEEEGMNIGDFKRYLLESNTHFKFFFHAGETNWYGSTDLNLIDAILLNTSRIGHGFALPKHPVLMDTVKTKNIPIELCPISNQVLMMNQDPRNHPAVFLIANGFRVVIGNDDPSAWGATGLSYDWYIVFMAMTSEGSGIEILKQFAIDSIKYSAMTDAEKLDALKKWSLNWEAFLDEMLI